MKTVNLKFTGMGYVDNPIVYVDEKPIKLVKNQFNNLTSRVDTENDKVNIKIYKALDVGGFLWFITQIFFFLISIFGIFDVRQKNRYLTLEYQGEIILGETNDITLRCNPPKDNAKAFEIEGDLQTAEAENKYYIDKNAKKRLKLLLITKIILALAIVATAIALIVF